MINMLQRVYVTYMAATNKRDYKNLVKCEVKH